MNKYKYIIGAIVLAIAFIFGTNIDIVKADEYGGRMIAGEYAGKLYVKKVRPDGTKRYNRAQFIRRSTDNAFVYCLQPFVVVDENSSYNTTFTDYQSILNLSDSQWKRISLLAYYGYGYGSHTNDEWYYVTQVLIWRTVEPDTDIFFTDTLNGNRNDSILANELQELDNLVNSHNIRPSFSMNSTMNVGSEITLNDNNNVLDKYTIISSNNLEVSKNGNQLKIKANNVGNASIAFQKKDNLYNTKPVLYYSTTSQAVVSVGSYDPITSLLNFKVVGGKVTAEKLDSQTLSYEPMGDATLIGAEYGVYNERNEKVGQLKIGDNNKGTSDYLPTLGRFYLKEEQASVGYQLDDTKYWFEITANNLYPTVKVYEDVIEADIELFKVYANGSTAILTGEPNIEFEFYLISSGKLFITGTTNSKGKLKVTLPYGKFRVHQKTSTTNYEKVDDFEITVDEHTESPYFKVISNAEITAKLKVVKVDSESKNIIARSNIKFKIIDVSTGEYVRQTITYPTAQTIDTFETDSNGILITPLPLKSGIYKLEEVDQRIDGYLWNNTSKEFEIGENAELITDSEFGVIFETKFENTQVKGEVIINKIGEKLVIENGSYHYEEIKLDNVKYNLYAEKDIYSADGTLIYKANDLVGSYKTKDGFLKINDLYLGSYYFLETSTLDSHVLDTTKHSFTLKYKDQYTPIISLEFTLKNYMKKGTLNFTKTDVEGNFIPGTKIQIWTNNDDEESVMIFEGVTDDEGKIKIEDLFLSKFKIIEVEPSPGFKLSDEVIEFEIKKDKDVVDTTLVNETIEVPNTSISDSKVLDIIGVVLILLGVGYIIYDKKKKK